MNYSLKWWDDGQMMGKISPEMYLLPKILLMAWETNYSRDDVISLSYAEFISTIREQLWEI